MGPVEQRQELVGGEFLERQHRPQWPRCCRTDTSVRSEIELRGIVAVGDDEADEPVSLPRTADLQASSDQSTFNRRAQTINVITRRSEEVEVTRGALNDPDATNAAPPASANPSASGSETTTRATRSCKALSTAT